MKAPLLLACLLALPLLSQEVLTIEAESFTRQTLDDVRRWEIQSDRPGASGGKSIQVLPDTRQSHADKLIKGENFMDEPGRMAALEYPIEVPAPGRYYVWARTWSGGSEDNGLHFGLDGQWPESGRRWQTVKKGAWHWDCKQRTQEAHTGVPMQLWLDIDKPGAHTLMMSMREDGAEVDQIILANNESWRPEGFAEEPPTADGDGEKPAAAMKFPDHWGSPPGIQTMDYRPLPGGYGIGSSTLAAWIQSKLNEDRAKRGPDGDGTVTVSGELRQWHKVTLDLAGPNAHERDDTPNPFTDLAFKVTFTHESGSPRHTVPGYFAADGDAANSGAQGGTVWRAHLSPDKAGKWGYTIRFATGKNAGLDGGGLALAPFDGKTGEFTVAESDKSRSDFRAKGRLTYIGKHHLQFAGTGEYFLKAGPDAPETMLAYADFDDTEARKKNVPLKTWAPHVGDWKPGDPTWKDGKGKGLIGALNYLSGKGVNAFSFLTYNAGGDGDNVWPFVERDDKLHYDCSKLAQWGVVFDHATKLGLYLHFKLQENEMDDDRRGSKSTPGKVPESLDGGKLGPERKLYCREMIARFGHALALNWNIGEENTQSTEEIKDMSKYLRDTDPYDHLIVVHTFPPQQEKVYAPLLGDKDAIAGVSLQNPWNAVHQRTLQWVTESAKAGHPWVVANDEQNPAGLGVPPDPGYKDHDGLAIERGKNKEDASVGDVKSKAYTMHDVRKLTLWGNLMAGGAGVEYYFGYALPENDLICEDWRSRDKSWDYCRIALNFFREEKIPFQDMTNANALIGNLESNNSKFCLAKPGELYLIYLPNGGACELDLSAAKGEFSVQWFNPREGGQPAAQGDARLSGGSTGKITAPSTDDWLAIVRPVSR